MQTAKLRIPDRFWWVCHGLIFVILNEIVIVSQCNNIKTEIKRRWCSHSNQVKTTESKTYFFFYFTPFFSYDQMFLGKEIEVRDSLCVKGEMQEENWVIWETRVNRAKKRRNEWSDRSSPPRGRTEMVKLVIQDVCGLKAEMCVWVNKSMPVMIFGLRCQ